MKNLAHRASMLATISADFELGSLAFLKAGNKSDGVPVFAKPWSETTDMQARPGARRSATSRSFSITAFSCLGATPSPRFQTSSLLAKN